MLMSFFSQIYKYCVIVITRLPVSACAVAAMLVVLSPSQKAQAVLVEAGKIDADGANSTVDLWFFSFAADTMTTINVNDLGGPPVVGADPDMIIYHDDGSFANIFASDTVFGADPSITANFLAGSYIAVIANNLLMPGEFGPFQADGALAVGGYDYELTVPAPGDVAISINCRLSGNLNGGYSKKVFPFGNGDTCKSPPTSVSAPGGAGLLAVAFLGLLAFSARRRQIMTG